MEVAAPEEVVVAAAEVDDNSELGIIEETRAVVVDAAVVAVAVAAMVVKDLRLVLRDLLVMVAETREQVVGMTGKEGISCLLLNHHYRESCFPPLLTDFNYGVECVYIL